MTVAIFSLWQLPHCHYGSCHIVMIRLPCMNKSVLKNSVHQKELVKNTIKCSRQPFWYILLENASCRKSAINLHQFMLITFSRSACTTQNFRTKKRLPHQKSNGKKHQKTLAVTSFTHDIGAKKIKGK